MAAVKHSTRPSAVPVVAFGNQIETSRVPSSTLQAGPLGSIPGLQCTSQPEETWDVVGLGQGMVDFSAHVDDAFLQRLDFEKGARRYVAQGPD